MKGDRVAEKDQVDELLKALLRHIKDGSISIIKHDSLIIQIDTHEVLSSSEMKWLSGIGG